jgi:hypothetical protein
MSDTVHVRSPFQSTYSDGSDMTKFQPSHQNADRLFTGGADGDVVTRDAASPTGASWKPAAAAAGPTTLKHVFRRLTNDEILSLPTLYTDPAFGLPLVSDKPGWILETLLIRLIPSFAVGYTNPNAADGICFMSVERSNDGTLSSSLVDDQGTPPLTSLTEFLTGAADVVLNGSYFKSFVQTAPDPWNAIQVPSFQDLSNGSFGMTLVCVTQMQKPFNGGDPANYLDIHVVYVEYPVGA